MDNLPISVIIPSKNAENTIEECLSSVQRNNPTEIIVVDGNSSDRTVEIAHRYTEKIYSDEGKGTSYAHQLGAEQASQEYIAYVDADIVLPECTLSTLLAELKASGYANIQAKVLAVSRSTYWERAQDQHTQILQTRRAGGLSAGLLRRDTVLNLKFDLSIKFAGDDYAFLSRLKSKGYKFGISSAFVYHHHRADLKSFAKRRLHLGWSSVQVIRKYGPWHASLWPPLSMLYWLAICLRKGKPGLIPYLVVSCITGTAGMVKGFFELIGEMLERLRESGA
jgi:glycosyltransferase involved in cell wall biosynthesis